jgi:hypothetical protein
VTRILPATEFDYAANQLHSDEAKRAGQLDAHSGLPQPTVGYK